MPTKCNGVLIGVCGSGNVIRLQPPLVITKQQIDHALGDFGKALQEAAQPAHATA
jgi:4-aminobutyrate aminotransferase-like enzyme